MKSFKELKDLHRDNRDSYPENFNIRVHRALSWLNKSEQEKDPGAQFIFLWISLNSTYSIKDNEYSTSERPKDFELRYMFFISLVKHGKEEIDEAIKKLWGKEIHDILDNEQLLNDYWDKDEYDYYEKKYKDKEKVKKALENNKNVSKIILPILFARLYVLRNQIFHGFSTYNSGANRDTVISGSNVLQILVPLFIMIMMNYADEDWGTIAYHPDGR